MSAETVRMDGASRQPGRLGYYRRIFGAYLTNQKSQLTFWHDVPEVNERARPDTLGEYYMPFTAKADYQGARDEAGIPLLDYRGRLGLQYNPIAIAQYGLGNYNLYRRTADPERRRKLLLVADWLVGNLERNSAGLAVWHHKFDWEYRTPLRAPWYSALAQGQGISVLVRAHAETGRADYLRAAADAFQALLYPVENGGVAYVDERGQTWLEEYVVHPHPPTHILNGFIWASWGVYDYALATHSPEAEMLFARAMDTIGASLPCYEAGFWSLYEQSGTRLKMLASPFYHSLHIVQLRVLHRLTGGAAFRDRAERWEGYRRSRPKRAVALAYKAAFKLLYY